MRRLFAIAAFVLATAIPTHALAANTWGTDLSDLWWNPAESGWGANFAHQGDIIFMTLFAYGSDDKVKWYVAPALGSQGGSGTYTFTGILYETTGPFLGGNFNPASVGTRQAGTATIAFQGVSQATFTYSVDGVNVTKSIQRQTFRTNDMNGGYLGAMLGSKNGCGASSGVFEDITQFVIRQLGAEISITTMTVSGLSCTLSGDYTQSGRMGSIAGTASCTNGTQGSFQALEVEASYRGFLSRYTVDYGSGCTETGHIGGVKRGQ